MRGVGVILFMGAMVVSGCGAPTAPTPAPRTLPGPMEELPPGEPDIAFTNDWADATRLLPAGLDAGARWTEDEVVSGVTMPFGDRPMPPGGPGIASVVLPESGADEIIILTSLPTFTDEAAWGEQYVIVVAEEADGWAIQEAYVRTLCRRDGADGGACAR